jgi:hypothetical protein
LKTRSGPEKSSPEVLKRVKPGEHAPKTDGGDDGNPKDRAQSGEGA